MKQNRKCGPGCNCIKCRNLYATHLQELDIYDIKVEELVQESWLVEDNMRHTSVTLEVVLPSTFCDFQSNIMACEHCVVYHVPATSK